ncbi:F-box/LRR-repeat protein [Thalictrum thalictroides]|uniref:F-box/LRR-repeat protein n=1 Tax=Thalictrum thalictroides TaxID=46969 RepID=A0A7J6W6K0_THATH|nr:F-box/LRR-repeat protein [Thalictrum thalictroides]
MCSTSGRQFIHLRSAQCFSTVSSKKLKIPHNLREGEDVISSLHDDVLLFILSFLDIKFAVHTSILSKRWRSLWYSLRVMNFDHRLYPWFKKFPFKNSLDEVITVVPNVQEVYLKLSSEPSHCLFTWKSIRVLKLKDVDGFIWIRNPHSVDLPALEALHLTRVVLNMKLFNGFLSKSPLLEALTIKCCDFIDVEILNISSPKLKKLCRDYMTKRFSLENLSALVSAEIDLHFPFGSNEEYTKQVIQFLEGLSHAKFLTLSASSLEIFSSAMGTLQCLPTQLSNLRHFKITSSPNDACAHVLQLLKSSPNIESFHLEITWVNLNSYVGRLYWDEPLFYSTVVEVYWEAEQQFQCMYQLKFIKIKNFLGCENEIKFLKVLLMKATVLEKISIVLAQVWPYSRDKMMSVVWKMLQSVPRASPHVILEFVNCFVLKL